MKIAIGSENPVKIQAAIGAFKSALNINIQTVKYVPKITVSNTPFSIEDMIKGATERAIQSIESNTSCTFGVGIEGGLFKESGNYFLTAYAVVVDNKKNFGIGSAPSIKLPSSWKFSDDLFFEFGDYVDLISKKNNIKKKEGAMGFLTGNKLVRKEALQLAVLCAYYSHLNEFKFTEA